MALKASCKSSRDMMTDIDKKEQYTQSRKGKRTNLSSENGNKNINININIQEVKIIENSKPLKVNVTI